MREPPEDIRREKVRVVPLEAVDDFPNHPFEVRDDESMRQLIQSIARKGVLNPVIARRKENERYELISGHRRKHACEVLGIRWIPIIVRDMSRDEAIVDMVDSNLQREFILPSEKARAYKMKMEAMKRRAGRPSKENLSPVGTNLRTDAIIAQDAGESRNQIQRYIRLNELTPELLALVDTGRIGFRPAVELSYLKEEEQRDLYETMESEDCTPSLSQAMRMKELSREGRLDMDAIFSMMTEQKANQQEKVHISMERLKRYFPRGTPPKRVEEIIIRALEYYRTRQRDDRDER